MADAPTMPEDRRLRFEARIKLVRQISHAREQEQKRIGDQIEQLLYETQSVEVAETLVRLAHTVFDGDKR